MGKILTLFYLIFSSSLAIGQEKNITYKVGDFTQGGIVFWVDDTAQHGLVCAKSDQGSNIQWDTEIDFKDVPRGGAYPPERDTKSVAILDGIYAGKKNTKSIINFVGKSDIPYAAKICDEFKLTQDSCNYDDWYLPSRVELNMMYINRVLINEVAIKHGGDSFERKSYWSSTDVDCSEKPYCFIDRVHDAWGHNFSLGGKKYQLASRKYMPYSVRAIRSF